MTWRGSSRDYFAKAASTWFWCARLGSGSNLMRRNATSVDLLIGSNFNLLQVVSLGSLAALDLMYRSITYGTDSANAVSMETTVAWGHRHKTGSQMWDSSAFTSRQTRSALRRGSRAIPLAREHHKEEGGHTARSSQTPGNTRTTRRKFLSILQWTAESFEPSLPSQRARTFSLCAW